MSFVKKQKEFFGYGIIPGLGVAQVFTSFALAMITTIWALYINSFVNSIQQVAFISTFLSVVSLISFFLIAPLIEKNDKSKLLLYSLLIASAFYLFFAYVKSFWVFIVFASTLTIIHAVRISSFGVLVKENSGKKEIANNEGMIYSLLNLGWLLGPLIAGFVFSFFEFKGVFLIASGFALTAFLILSAVKIKDHYINKDADGDFFKNLIGFLKSKERVLSYGFSMGMHGWWALVYIFMPLLTINNGLNEKFVGYFLFAIVVPLILLEYPFSKIVGKRGYGFQFKIGFFLTAIVAFSCFFTENIFLIMFFMTLSGVSTALIEPTVESYFMSVTKGKETGKFYGPFNTSKDMGLIAGKFFPGILLGFFSFKSVFLFFGFFMFAMFLLAYFVKK
jgi:MFS family permease